jgi:Mg-chelatase subunit ChlD
MNDIPSRITRAMDPVYGHFERHLVVLIDVSPSMLQTDYPPTRLDAARNATLELLIEMERAAQWARVAIVGFGATISVGCGLTSVAESGLLRTALAGLKPIKGTDLGAGLLAAEILLGSHNRLAGASQEVLLLSDGGHNADTDPTVVSDRLQSNGVLIRTRGIGSRQAVDEELLCRIASHDSHDEPLYEFLADSGSLTEDFRNIGGITR